MIAGKAIAGNAYTGGEQLDGEIVDLAVFVSSAEATVTFSHIGVDPLVTEHRIMIAINGELESILSNGESEFTISPEDGDFNILVKPLRPDTEILPDLHGDPFGRRTFLNWEPSPETDVRGYRIFDSTDAQIGSVSGTSIEKKKMILPGTGTGLGKITIEGDWTGEDTNKLFNIEITSTGFRHDLTGTWSASKAFAINQRFNLPNGVRVTFHSDRSKYDTGDTFSFRAGPVTQFLTGELADGTHTFKIRSIDAAGNLSAYSQTLTNKIVSRPDRVVNPSISFDGTDLVVSWGEPSDASFAGVNVYSNLSNATGTLRDYVIESSPWNSYSEGTTSFTINAPGEGLHKFYVRSFDSNGLEDDDIRLLTVDTSAVPTTIDLNSPEQLIATPTAGGSIRVSFVYNWTGGEDCTTFNVYLANSAAGVLANIASATTEETLAVSAALNAQSYSIDLPTDYSADPLIYIAIRASTGTFEDGNVSTVTVAPDSAAPTAPAAHDAISQ